MAEISWKLIFAGVIFLGIVNYFAEWVEGYYIFALFVACLVIYFIPRVWKKELVLHDIDWCSEKVKDWAIEKRGIHLTKIVLFQDATRISGEDIFEVVFLDRNMENFRVEINRRTGQILRFLQTVSLERDYFSSTDDEKRFRHILRKREIPTVRERIIREPGPPAKEEEKEKESRFRRKK